MRGLRFHNGADEDSMLLERDALSVGKYLPAFRKISVPSSSESFRLTCNIQADLIFSVDNTNCTTDEYIIHKISGC